MRGLPKSPNCLPDQHDHLHLDNKISFVHL